MSIFQYATIADVREENVTKHSDKRVLEFIELASRFINNQTEQFFIPVYERHILNGDGTKSLNPQDRIPIQEIKSIDDQELPPAQQLELSNIIVPNRRSKKRREVLIQSGIGLGDSTFTNSTNNIFMEGVFGWLEPRFENPIEREIASDASAMDTEVELVNADKVDDHFVPVVGKETLPIISEINGTTVKFDQEIRFPISAGDKMVFYGLTPSPIRRATIQIAIQSAHKLGSGSGNLDFTETPEFKARVISENTDNYRYRLSEDVPEGTIKQGDLTGNVFNILREYTVDPFFKMGAV